MSVRVRVRASERARDRARERESESERERETHPAERRSGKQTLRDEAYLDNTFFVFLCIQFFCRMHSLKRKRVWLCLVCINGLRPKRHTRKRYLNNIEGHTT